MDIIIQNSSGRPIYEQIYSQLKAQIISGALEEGAALPSIRLLAKELRISVITTRRAYDDLEKDGLIETVAGKGSFVAAKDAELLREAHLTIAQEHMQKAIDAARTGGITRPELHEMLDILYEG